MEDLVVFCNGDLDAITLPAMQLEAIMLSDEDAQARYSAIYGRPWQSLEMAMRDFASEASTVSMRRVVDFDDSDLAWFRAAPASCFFQNGSVYI